MILQELAARGVKAEIFFTNADPQNDDLDSAILNAEKIIAVGGDGTLNRVARPILLCSKPEAPLPAVAFFPLGTGNVAARAFHLPRHIPDMVDLVVSDTRLKIDAGIVSREGVPCAVFLLWFGAGLDGALIHAVAKSRACHGYTGSRLILQYILETPLTFFTYPFPKVEVKSKQINGEFAGVILANIGLLGLGSVTRKADPQDGLVNLLAAQPRSRLSWCLSGLLAAAHGFDLCPGVSRSKERLVHLSANEWVPVQIDGEPWGPLPVSIEIRKAALSLIAPDTGSGG